MQTNILNSKRWLTVAIGGLMTGGLLSVILVIGRAPLVNTLFADPNFAKKCLIVHVNLTIFVWFSAFIVALFNLLRVDNKTGGAFGLPLPGAAAGLLLLTISLFIPAGKPVLSNYIPVIDHMVFFAGLGIFACSVTLAIADFRLWQPADTDDFPAPAILGIRFAVLTCLLAGITFLISRVLLDEALPVRQFYEMLFWGVGHVLQFAHIFAMLAVWIFLIKKLTGSLFITKKPAFCLFTLMFLPLVSTPYFAAQIQNQGLYLLRFTQLMQYGIFPVVCIFIFLAVKHLYAAKKNDALQGSLFAHFAFNGFAAAVVLILTGFIFGALIEGSDTMIPAHYHAAIGAVTVSFMATSFALFPQFDLNFPTERLARLARWQPALYGAGQFLLASGLAYARMMRKIYGEEQIVHSVSQKIGLGIMGIGGLFAVCGGILFIWITLRTFFSRRQKKFAVI